MGNLEERFFSKKGETLIKSEDEKADEICRILRRAICREDYVLRGGMPAKYFFNFDGVYS